MPYCFFGFFLNHPSNFKFTWDQKITNFDPNCEFPHRYSILNSPMAVKWCTKLDIVYKRCPFVFRGHPSNFKVTWSEKSTIWIQFLVRLQDRSQLSNPIHLPCCKCFDAALLTQNFRWKKAHPSPWIFWVVYKTHKHTYSIDSRYIAVIYDAIMHAAQQLQWYNFGQICTHERHRIPLPNGRAMGCLSWVIRRKMTAIYRERIVHTR